MAEKLVEIGILFDFYGKLLSDTQYFSIKLYYIYDLSFAEIGEELDITRQGVFDAVKRGEQKLYDYEEKLKLVAKFHSNHEDIKKIISFSKEIIENINSNEDVNKKIKNKALLIEEISNNILKNK